MTTTPSIEAFVLAGGKSSRMGQDKGMMPLSDRPMVRYVLDELQRLHLPAKIVANQAAYAQFGITVLRDEIADKGPMGGLFTSLCHTQASHILLLACDMPFISAEAIQRLIKNVGEESVTVAEAEGKQHPLFAVYKAALKSEVELRILGGKLTMQKLVRETSHRIVVMDDLLTNHPRLFSNINSANDLKENGL